MAKRLTSQAANSNDLLHEAGREITLLKRRVIEEKRRADMAEVERDRFREMLSVRIFTSDSSSHKRLI